MKQLIISILTFIHVSFANSQTVADIFIKMPDKMIIQLEKAWRKDIIDLYKSGKTASLENTMQGRSVLKKLTNNYLFLETTERSSLEIKLLPLINDTYIICVISTVYAPVADSKAEFYTIEWKKLPDKELFTPITGAWFWKENVDTLSVKYIEAQSLILFDLIKYSLNENDNTMTAEYTFPESLSDEERKKLLPFLKTENKVYEWKLSRFE
ncbi:MAG: DUF3256 family protein [Tannerella sp.]|jgi:hypothetical protein|nr:DUF3256 family protein [Tannerella sp.]